MEKNSGAPLILLADDSPLYRTLLQHWLTKSGYDVEAVTGGRAALELFREDPQHFDAVILDLNMPGLDGLQTWEKLRRLRPRLPTVFCSADLAYFGNQLPGCECVRALNKPYSSEGVKKVALALQEVIDLCGS